MKAFFHIEQLAHEPGPFHSRGKERLSLEVPERALCFVRAARDLGFAVESPSDAGMEPILAAHSAPYVAFLENAYTRWKRVPEDWGDEVTSSIFVREPNALRGILAEAGKYLADGVCPIGRDTWKSAYWSAQSAIAGARAIIDGAPAAYAICRPPGHHARKDAAGGFCYLNNAAIAAQELLKRFRKVAILDPDMHHGQGIQEIFYDRSDVFYVSIHGDPTNFYPVVAGFADEQGVDEGKGYNLNLPMPHGSTESYFFDKLNEALNAISDYEADVLVLSLGFDIYERDPESRVSMSRGGFSRMGEVIRSLGLPCLIVQEGGYDIESLGENANAFFASSDAWSMCGR